MSSEREIWTVVLKSERFGWEVFPYVSEPEAMGCLNDTKVTYAEHGIEVLEIVAGVLIEGDHE